MTENNIKKLLNNYGGDTYEIKEALEMYNLLLTLNKDSKVVELGCLYGLASKIIGEASEIVGFEFTSIDSFVINGEDAEKSYVENILNVYEKANLIKGTTNDVSKMWSTPIDYLFIDADHQDHSIDADCRNWLPFVKGGGIVQFHDYANWRFPAVAVRVDQYTGGWERISIKDSSLFLRKP